MTYTQTSNIVPGYEIRVGYSEERKAWNAAFIEVKTVELFGESRTHHPSLARTILGDYPTADSAIDAARACIAMLDEAKVSTLAEIDRVRAKL